ncbi:MAG: 16S rRNA (guanine(966)-N(2))-methyltransferase RsmD [Waddliaceae bacterium]
MRIIGGKFKNRPLTSPKGTAVRPTSSRLRETLFNICQQEIEGARFLDLFAGSGAMGIEAISRGASFCVFSDKSRTSLQVIEKNINHLELGTQAQVLLGDAKKIIEQLNTRKAAFDLIFLDPPYNETTLVCEIMKEIDQTDLLINHGSLFLEEGGDFDPNTPFTNLTLSSRRKCGSTFLLHYKMERQ